MNEPESLRVAIDAQMIAPNWGGVAQAIVGLVRALGELDGPETYEIVVWSDDAHAFVEPYVGRNQRIVRRPGPGRPSIVRRIKRRAARELAAETSPAPTVPISDGYYEGLGVDVLHFPHQWFVICALPTIYNPHDLQHRHLPQFFPPRELAEREVVWRTGCQLARTVAVASRWVKQDVIEQYGLSAGKIQVIPWAPPTQAYPEPSDDKVASVRAKYELDQPFFFYPARTWPHKNHRALFEALAILRDERGLTVRLICTGSIDDASSPVLAEQLHRLELDQQVRFLGFLAEEELRAVYRLAEALVLPTLFESDSFPIFEAWFDGLPVACSSVTSLPDQVGDAALVFDPAPAAIADALARLIGDPGLRADLREKGRERLTQFTWDKTAKAYRALYRRAGGRPLSDEDRELLEWDWMLEPAPVEVGRA